jgi:hypothetical protein
MELDTIDTAHMLDHPEWERSRSELGKLGGPPRPFDR